MNDKINRRALIREITGYRYEIGIYVRRSNKRDIGKNSRSEKALRGKDVCSWAPAPNDVRATTAGGWWGYITSRGDRGCGQMLVNFGQADWWAKVEDRNRIAHWITGKTR